MKPIPAQQSMDTRNLDSPIPTLTAPLNSNNNRRSQSSDHSGAYPWLLAISTISAGFFCFMYITKPILSTGSTPASASHVENQTHASEPDQNKNLIAPLPDRLPGETQPTSPPIKSIDPLQLISKSIAFGSYEETNLKIQHILSAEADNGQISRIDIDVPVLYQSRNLHWTTEQVAQARVLQLKLMDYQDKARQLRSEGLDLLHSWNQLISQSIPTSQLRADSPSLPENQKDAALLSVPSELISTESIQIQSPHK